MSRVEFILMMSVVTCSLIAFPFIMDQNEAAIPSLLMMGGAFLIGIMFGCLIIGFLALLGWLRQRFEHRNRDW
ncbi:MAG: hypothetical protein ACE366_31360 [Bradymonadia bacterium]